MCSFNSTRVMAYASHLAIQEDGDSLTTGKWSSECPAKAPRDMECAREYDKGSYFRTCEHAACAYETETCYGCPRLKSDFVEVSTQNGGLECGYSTGGKITNTCSYNATDGRLVRSTSKSPRCPSSTTKASACARAQQSKEAVAKEAAFLKENFTDKGLLLRSFKILGAEKLKGVVGHFVKDLRGKTEYGYFYVATDMQKQEEARRRKEELRKCLKETSVRFNPSRPQAMATLLHLLAVPMLAVLTLGQSTTTIPPPGQPFHPGVAGEFQLIGDSLVSAQQLFLGTEKNVYFVDKVENNPTRINGHPAWASEWTVASESQRTMDAKTNSFCAGGNVMGNGTWVNIGGNQAVTYGGEAAPSQHGGGPYNNPDGRRSIRLLNPCDDGNCDWILSPVSSAQRWYPTIETLEDGTLIILGGCRNGGYVNDAYQDNPTYEFFPPKGDPILSPVLQRTLPANLYPLTWLLPSGKLLIQSNWATVLLDYRKRRETTLDDIPDAVRTYPASAGTIMMPLTPANNWTATIMFCGGSDVQPRQWLNPNWIIPTYPASASCVKLTPDVSKSYVQDDPLPEGRSMANLIFLPDGKILCLNGAKLGTAGYGNQSWAIGMSYADQPVLTPVMYDPAAPAGKRWSRGGLSASNIPRMYHSSATLLPDGSVFVSGSNPNSDYNVGPTVEYPTEYRTERFYPPYYNKRRPQPVGLLRQLSYGGPSFDVTLDADDLFGDIENVKKASIVIIRPGFSTHSMNMGQRFVQLESTYTGFRDNTAVLHVSQLPPNPAILAPGPAFIFVVVNGVPSVGAQVMVGSGSLGAQSVQPIGDLPASSMEQPSSELGAAQSSHNAASSQVPQWLAAAAWGILLVVISYAW
ncbi:hypothetical protein D9615_002586 [Tricholomella constricta]|uniref:Copper radical oxidase n=1 Tax=Tricholomella constricta TaxID=117010 RepID=A0A8H5HM60_9AGAR|nr:hypothetical protein D9615_002586 [Tricholomella constricta]